MESSGSATGTREAASAGDAAHRHVDALQMQDGVAWRASDGTLEFVRRKGCAGSQQTASLRHRHQAAETHAGHGFVGRDLYVALHLREFVLEHDSGGIGFGDQGVVQAAAQRSGEHGIQKDAEQDEEQREKRQVKRGEADAKGAHSFHFARSRMNAQ